MNRTNGDVGEIRKTGNEAAGIAGRIYVSIFLFFPSPHHCFLLMLISCIYMLFPYTHKSAYSCVGAKCWTAIQMVSEAAA